MTCDECGINQASIKIMTLVNGEKRERHLCAECMNQIKKQFTAMDISALAGLLSSILQVAQTDKPESDEAGKPDIICPVCNISYENFRDTGFLGCADCYVAFREPLEAMLKRVHGHTQHVGRIPGGATGDLSIRLKIDGLKQQLGRAIAEEAYEQAASLRDEIRTLKRQLETSVEKEGAAHE